MAESKKFKCCIEEYDFLSVHLHREDKEVFITVNNEIKLVDSFVEDLLSKDDVSNVYVKEIKTISHTTFYRK